MDKCLCTDPKLAQRIFVQETSYFGPEELGRIGIEVDEVPPIPLSEEMLLRLKRLRISLEWYVPGVLREMVSRFGNNPIEFDFGQEISDLIFDEDKKGGESHWRAVSRQCISYRQWPFTGFLGQTCGLADYLRSHVFVGHRPKRFLYALEELGKDQIDELAGLALSDDWEAGAQAIEALAINQLYRGTVAQRLYDIFLHRMINGNMLNFGSGCLTRSLLHDGRLVAIGSKGKYSVVWASGMRPSDSSWDVGVCLSCRAEDLSS